MKTIARSILLISILSLVVGAPLIIPTAAMAAQTRAGIAAYCRAHPTEDYPKDRTVFPKGFADAGASYWRCLGGQALVCGEGAAGRACIRVDISGKPPKTVRETCAASPGLDIVPSAAIGDSASMWRCRGKTPVATSTVKTDSRRFMTDAWIPLSKVKLDEGFPGDPR